MLLTAKIASLPTRTKGMASAGLNAHTMIADAIVTKAYCGDVKRVFQKFLSGALLDLDQQQKTCEACCETENKAPHSRGFFTSVIVHPMVMQQAIKKSYD